MKISFDSKLIFNLYLILLGASLIFGFLFAVFIAKIPVTISFLLHSLFFVIPYFLAVLFLASFAYKNQEIVEMQDAFDNRTIKSALISLFIIVYLASVIYLNIVESIVLPNIILLVGLYSIIFIQIAFTRMNPAIIITELITTFLVSIFSVTLRHEHYIGNTDILLHLDWASIVSATDRVLPPEMFWYTYSHYPVVHIFTAIGSDILNIPLVQSYFGIMGLLFTLSILFMYCIFKILVNERIALLACLFFASTNHMVTFGIHIIPYCIAFVFFILLLLLLLKYNINIKNRILFLILLIPVITALLYTHHASQFYVIGLLLLFYIMILLIQRFTGDKTTFNPFPIVLFIIAFLIHWYYIARDFTFSMEMNIKNYFLHEDIIETAGLQAGDFYGIQDQLQQNLVFLITNYPSIILASFVIIGVGLAIQQKNHKLLWVFAIFSFLSLVLWIPVGTQFVNFFEHFAAGRLFLYTSPFIMIIFAFGFYRVLNHRFNHSKKYIPVLLTVFFIIFSCTSLINISNYEFMFIPMNGTYTHYFTDEDTASMNFLDNYTRNNIVLISDDFPVRYVFVKRTSETFKALDWHYYQGKHLNGYGPNNEEGAYIYYRKGEFEKYGQLPCEPDPIPYRDHLLLEQSFTGSNKIFNTGNNEIYLNP